MPVGVVSQNRRLKWQRRNIRNTPPKTAHPEWPYRTDPMETIDRAMDVQHTLFELAQVTNTYYRLQLLIMIITAFMQIVFDCYGMMDLSFNTRKSQRVDDGTG